MAERVVNGYKRLFEVRILHHYWLDEGSKVFDSLDEDVRNARLLRYDVRQFLSIQPTKTTEHLLQGLQCVFKPTALGGVVAIPSGILITDNPTFEFVIKIEHKDFFNYTALTFRPQKLYELSSQADNTTYRYKDNVFVFSNLKGVSKTLNNPPHPIPTTTNPNPAKRTRDIRFLSQQVEVHDPTINYKAESLVQTSDLKLWQAVRDQPGSTLPSTAWAEFADINHQPIYVHQGDIPNLSLQSGMSGPPYRGIELKSSVPEDVFALIQIEKLADTDPMGLMNGATYRSPVFEIRLKNRSTIWRYRDSKNPTAVPTEVGPFPLTYYGNASSPVRQKPVGHITADVNGNQVTQLVSEIII